MKLSPAALLAASLAAGPLALVGCAADTTNPADTDADGNDAEGVASSEDELSVLGKQFVGKFEWHALDSGAFVDIETIDLRADGTYSAKVEATLVNPGVRCFRFPCTLSETGKWNAYKVSGKTKIRLRPSTNKARVYGAGLSTTGELSLTRLGATTTLFRAALLTCANVRCAAGTHCEMKGINGGSIPVCIADPPPPPPPPQGACVKTGCSGQICADQDMFSTCEYRPEYACYQTATCERQANGQCGWTQTPALTACLGGN